jgi:hypothetical protein
MKMDDSRYMNWYWNEAKPEEKRLADKSVVKQEIERCC